MMLYSTGTLLIKLYIVGACWLYIYIYINVTISYYIPPKISIFPSHLMLFPRDQPRSGTSQSCGLAAGAAALVREYLSDWASTSQARLGDVWASSVKALLVAAAKLDRWG